MTPNNAKRTKPPTLDRVGRPVAEEAVSPQDAWYATNAARWEGERREWRLAEAAFEGIAVSQDGIIADVNPAFCGLFGYDAPEALRGTSFESLVAEGSRAAVRRKIAEHDQEPYEVVAVRRDGSTFEAELRGRPIELKGRLARITAMRDVSERNGARRVLLRAQARLAEAQGVAHIGSWSLDVPTGRVSWSEELFRIFGMDPAEGEPAYAELLRRYHPDDVAAYETATQRGLNDGEPYEFDLRVARPEGGYRWTHAVARGAKDSAGVVVRLYGTLTDVHERKLLEAELRRRAEKLAKSEQVLRALLDGAPVVLYAADSAGIVTVSEGTGLAAMGLKPGEAVGRSVFGFCAGDAETESYFRRALAGETLSFESRLGSLAIQTELRPTQGVDGEPSGFIGVCLDVTERARSEERFRVLFEKSSDAHLLFDESGIIDCNPAAMRLLRCQDASQVFSVHPAALSPEFQPDGRRSDEKCVEMDALARLNGLHRFEWTHRRFDGEEFPVEVSLTYVTLGERPVLLTVWHDLTERKRAERQIADYAALLETQRDELDKRLLEAAEMNIVLEAQRYELEAANARLNTFATTDGLTGILNHRAFQERLETEIERSRRTGEPLSIALLDVDLFKDFNDQYGHQAGDAVLRAVAAALTASARIVDIVARYGGEEFVAILPGAGEREAFAIAERLRLAIAGIALEYGAVTASFGMATFGPALSQEALIEAADQAMYLSKEGGRNRTTSSV